MYSAVVHSNMVGNTKLQLIREVLYKRGGSGSTYFEVLHMQWIPMHRSFLDAVEVQLAKSSGGLVKSGPSKTIVTFQFRLGKTYKTIDCTPHHQRKENRHARR